MSDVSHMTGAEAMVRMLQLHGVKHIFGLCGDTSLPFYDALARSRSITHVLTRDERHAGYMADGYARVTGKVGVCEGPSGGGATYILPGLAEANESSIPVLAINTDISVSSRGRFTLTELDQRTLMKPVTKWNAVLDRAADIPRVFRQAFVEMTRAAWPTRALDRLLAVWDGAMALPVAVGVTGAGHNVPLASLVNAYLQALAANLISAGVRLVPLGQTEGQRLLARLQPLVVATATRALASALEDVGGAAFRADIASMRHETQYTRLFRS